MPTPYCPSIALVAYAEPFVDGRRVVVFGDAGSALAEHLMDRGAKLVHVYDTDDERVAQAAARPSIRGVTLEAVPQSEGGLQVEAKFDFGIVENISAFPKPKKLLEQLAQVLSARAVALIGAPNIDARLKLIVAEGAQSANPALGYYELYDHVAEQFSDVRMLGQLPFVGYAIADFSAEREADISVDTGFVPTGAEEPEWFWALASHEPIVGDAFSIVQLPLSHVLAPALSSKPAKAQPKEASVAVPQAHALSQRNSELEQQLVKKENWIAELQARAETADARADQIQAELAQLTEQQIQFTEQRGAAQSAQHEQFEVQLQQLQAQCDVIRAERDAAQAACDAANTERDAARAEASAVQARLVSAEQRLLALQERNRELEQEVAGHAAGDVATLEGVLKERGALVEKLERQLAEAERVVGDLVRELEMLRTQQTLATHSADVAAALGELQSKLDQLALANAERAALLQSAEWTIRELEGKLAERMVQGPSPSQPGAPTSTLEQQLELAHSEIQRQAALLHQQQQSGAG